MAWHHRAPAQHGYTHRILRLSVPIPFLEVGPLSPVLVRAFVSFSFSFFFSVVVFLFTCSTVGELPTGCLVRGARLPAGLLACVHERTPLLHICFPCKSKEERVRSEYPHT